MKPSLSNSRQNNLKTTSLHPEPKPFTTLYVTFEEEISDSIEKSIQNNNAIPLPSCPPNNSTSSHSNQSQQVPKVTEIDLVDFEFRPKRVKIPANSTVRWKIGENKSSHQSNIYSGAGRNFVIYIKELDVESDLLSQGKSFEHIFTEGGEYNIECSNYSRIKGTIEVFEGNQEIAGELKKRGLLKNQREVDNYLSKQKAANSLSQLEDRKTIPDKLPTVGDLYYQELLEEYNSRMYSEEEERLERDKPAFVFPPSTNNKVNENENKDDSNDITTDNSSLFSERDKANDFDIRNRVPPIEDILEHISKQEIKTAAAPLRFVAQSEEQKFAEPSKDIHEEEQHIQHIDIVSLEKNSVNMTNVLKDSECQGENIILEHIKKENSAKSIESQDQGTDKLKEDDMNKENINKNKKKAKNKKNKKKKSKTEENSTPEKVITEEKKPEPIQPAEPVPPVQLSEEKLKTADLKASLLKKLRNSKNEAKLNKEALEKEKAKMLEEKLAQEMKKAEETEKRIKLVNENRVTEIAKVIVQNNTEVPTSEKKPKNKKSKKKSKAHGKENVNKENCMKNSNIETFENQNEKEVEQKEEVKEVSFFDFIKKAVQERSAQIKNSVRTDKVIKSVAQAEYDDEELDKMTTLKAFLSNRFEYAEAFD